jgi:methylamine dehydrogenase accessory protein MauD
MSSAWIAAFTLLSIIVLVEAVVLLAFIRHVGVLTQRIDPIGALQDDRVGPTPGYRLPKVALEPVQTTSAGAPFTAPLSLLYFFAPDCSLCADLIPSIQAVAKSYTELAVYFVSEVTATQATTYIQRHNVAQPTYVADDLFHAWSIDGTPFFVVATSDGTVVQSGSTNTLEQLETLLEVAISDWSEGAPAPVIHSPQ